MRRRSATGSIDATSWPSTSTTPEVTSKSRFTVLRSVVLPLPDGPTSTANVPRGMSSVTSATAASPPSYRLTTCWNETTGCVLSIASEQGAGLQKTAGDVGRLLLLAVHLSVELAHDLVGEQRRQRIQRGRDSRMSRQGLHAHHGRHR